jgi:branched-chain amino acid transport system permease protein
MGGGGLAAGTIGGDKDLVLLVWSGLDVAAGPRHAAAAAEIDLGGPGPHLFGPEGAQTVLAFQLMVNGLIAGGFYAMTGLGFALQRQVSRFFDFAYFGAVAVGAYGCWAVLELVPAKPDSFASSAFWLAAACGAAAGAALSWLFEVLIYRRLRARGASPLVLMLASLGLFTVVVNAVSLLAGDDTKVIRPGPVTAGMIIQAPLVGRASITRLQLAAVLLALAAGGGLAGWLRFSPEGRRLRAVADDPELAVIHGVDADHVRSRGHLLGGLLAGVGGICLAMDSDITPGMGLRVLLTITAAMVIGGVDQFFGVVLGAVLVGLIQNLIVLAVDSRWQDAVVFSVLVLVLLVRPMGLLGSARSVTIEATTHRDRAYRK